MAIVSLFVRSLTNDIAQNVVGKKAAVESASLLMPQANWYS